MATTKVLKAPYGLDGSLLHHVSDEHRFSHYESDAGERLERSDIWQRQGPPPEPGSRWGQGERQIRTDWRMVYTKPEWRDNLPFSASFQIDSVRSGRSAKYLMMRPVNLPLDKRTFPIFIIDLVEVARRVGFQPGGIVSGRWMVAKRGQNYGLRLAKDDE